MGCQEGLALEQGGVYGDSSGFLARSELCGGRFFFCRLKLLVPWFHNCNREGHLVLGPWSMSKLMSPLVWERGQPCVCLQRGAPNSSAVQQKRMPAPGRKSSVGQEWQLKVRSHAVTCACVLQQDRPACCRWKCSRCCIPAQGEPPGRAGFVTWSGAGELCQVHVSRGDSISLPSGAG